MTGVLTFTHFCAHINLIVVVVNHCCTSFFGGNSLLSDIVIVIWNVFLCSPDKGFWACLGDLPQDMPRRPETWVSLCNLMLKLRGISRSSAILGSDIPQSNNRKGNSININYD